MSPTFARSRIVRALAIGPLLLCLGAVAGYLAGSETESRASREGEYGRRAIHVPPAGEGSPPSSEGVETSDLIQPDRPVYSNASKPLREELGDHRDFLADYRARRAGTKETDVGARAALAREFCDWANHALPTLRRKALEDPDVFLAFLKDAQTEPFLDFYLRDLMLCPHYQASKGEIAWSPRFSPGFEDFPGRLMEGLVDILKIGTPRQKLGVLALHQVVDRRPLEYQLLYRALVTDTSSPPLQAAALGLLDGDNLEEVLPIVANLVQTSSDPGILRNCYLALGRTSSVESERLLLERLASNPHPETNGCLAVVLRQRVREASLEEQPRYAQALLAAVRQKNDAKNLRELAYSALYLSLPLALPILEEAAARSPDRHMTDAIREAAMAIRAGETDGGVLRAKIAPHR